MKQIAALILLLFSLSSYSQEEASELKYMHGLSYQGNQVFQLERYLITVVREKIQPNEKGIKKTIKKNQYIDQPTITEDADLGRENVLLIGEQKTEKFRSDVHSYAICYIIPESDKESTIVLLQTAMERNPKIERAFMQAFVDNKLEAYVSDKWSTSEINFLGKDIKLGIEGRWMQPNSLQTPYNNGQVSWLIFDSKEDAEIDKSIRIEGNKKAPNFKVAVDIDVPVIFEGKQVTAKKTVHKSTIPGFLNKTLGGGYKYLVVYYVVAEVNGKYVSTILSYYSDDENDTKLAAFPAEFMCLGTDPCDKQEPAKVDNAE